MHGYLNGCTRGLLTRSAPRTPLVLPSPPLLQPSTSDIRRQTPGVNGVGRNGLPAIPGHHADIHAVIPGRAAWRCLRFLFATAQTPGNRTPSRGDMHPSCLRLALIDYSVKGHPDCGLGAECGSPDNPLKSIGSDIAMRPWCTMRSWHAMRPPGAKNRTILQPFAGTSTPTQLRHTDEMIHVVWSLSQSKDSLYTFGPPLKVLPFLLIKVPCW